MKILVCVSKTPETTAKISFSADNTTFNSAGVQYIMNPYDEWYALVRALELKEQVGGSVTIINVGPKTNDQTIRKGLAIGADNAVRVDADPKSALYVAKQIAAHAKSESYDVVFFGKETIDYNGSEIGAMTAELLDLPFVSFATHLEMAGKAMRSCPCCTTSNASFTGIRLPTVQVELTTPVSRPSELHVRLHVD